MATKRKGEVVGYLNIRDNRRHEADAARIRELEAELAKEREAKNGESSKRSRKATEDVPRQSQTVVVNNEGCLTGAGKGCLLVVIAILILGAIGQLVSIFSGK